MNPILISSGDPFGVGVEIILKSLSHVDYSEVLVVGSKEVYEFYQDRLGTDHSFHFIRDWNSFAPDFLNIWNMPSPRIPTMELGKVSSVAGAWALESLKVCLSFLKQGFSKFLITAPVNKEAISLLSEEEPFTGHTEYLAKEFGVLEPVMLMASSKMKVALVSVHLPLSEVAVAISSEKVLHVIRAGHLFLQRMGVTEGRIGVSALNPHGGEGGYFGSEEEKISIAIQRAHKEGIRAEGPFASDTLFSRSGLDLFVAMYHDQGLIPFKLLSGWEGVNITLGLPFIRISVDHGTAFEIAGKNQADPRSMESALEWIYSLRSLGLSSFSSS